MDLQQRKLTKAEWVSIERPVDPEELRIVNLIIEGYSNVNSRTNNSPTLRRFLKIQDAKGIDSYIYTKYLQDDIRKLCLVYSVPYSVVKSKDKGVKKADLIRFANADKQLSINRDQLFEFVVLGLLGELYKKRSRKSKNWLFYFYTLSVVLGQDLDTANRTFMEVVKRQLTDISEEVNVLEVFKQAPSILESNSYLSQFADLSLYEHQRHLFSICKRQGAKLVSYIAPTGTGKTLSPLGLLVGHKVVFVCAARHVGLSLAKCAISANRKIAFAFGCNDSEDIRLHYFAAKEYSKNRRTGGIGKVDNSVGDNVEMIISDVKSYLPAMRYMMAFNDREDIITYWDEPTITMDYEDHEFHQMIQSNWDNNLIPNIVLSSATLPKPEDMLETIMDFKSRFSGAQDYSISSHDCKKTVRVVDSLGWVVMPHTIATSYADLKDITAHCRGHGALGRYMDLESITKFIVYLRDKGYIRGERSEFGSHFPDIGSLTSGSVKNYYLEVLECLDRTCWEELTHEMDKFRIRAYDSWVHATTSDAYTITNGPAIFLSEDVTKIARFYLSEVDMPSAVIEDIVATIGYNRMINRKIAALEKDLEDLIGDECLVEDCARQNPEAKVLAKRIENLKSAIRAIMPPSMFVPNTREHLRRFVRDDSFDGAGRDSFTSDITEQIVEEVMMIPDIEDTWKILLLLGIGTFTEHKSLRYLEVMKRLADEQRLFMIIASGDYIYGTNYQFCHGYMGKDLSSMSQEKCIQAMGRVGRGRQKHSYSIRFRGRRPNI